MGRKVNIILEGPATFSEVGKPTFRRGVPHPTTSESLIKWAENCSLFRVKEVKEVEPAKEDQPAESDKKSKKAADKKAASKRRKSD